MHALRVPLHEGVPVHDPDQVQYPDVVHAVCVEMPEQGVPVQVYDGEPELTHPNSVQSVV